MKKIIFLLLTFITLNIQAQVDWAELNGNVLFTNGVDSISFIIDSTGVPADSLYIYGTKPIKIKTSNDLVVNDFFYVYDNDSVSIDFGDDVMNFYYSDDTNYIKTDSVVVINGLVINPSGGHWTQNGDKIYYNTGNVGINTTNPQYRLEVDGLASVDTLNIVDSLLRIGGNDFLKLDYLENIYLGDSTGGAITTGTRNILIGHQTGNSLTTKGSNTMIGYESGENTTNENNTYMGYQAGKNSSSANNNTYIGYQAGLSSWTGDYNTYVGTSSGAGNSGNYNTALGYLSGYKGDGDYNVFLGNGTGRDATSSELVFVGYLAGYENTSGVNNTFIGCEAGKTGTTFLNNTLIGYKSGKILTGNSNTFLGNGTGQYSISANGNVFIGDSSGVSNITGDNNIFIGYKSGYNETGSNKLYIENSSSVSPLIYGDFSTDYLKFNVDSVRNTGDYYAKNIAIEDTYTGITSATFQNKSAAAAAVVGTLVKVINNSGYWGAIGMTNTGSTIQSGALINTFQNYNQGYGDFLFTNDGNVDFRWFSDPTNSHNFSAMGNEIMKLEANGDLTVSSNTYSDSVFSHHFGGLSDFGIGYGSETITITADEILTTVNAYDIVSSDVINLNASANNVVLTTQPTGTVDLAITTSKALNDTAAAIRGDFPTGGSPGGATTQVQYNNLNSFAGDADFTYASDKMTVDTVNVDDDVIQFSGSDFAKLTTDNLFLGKNNSQSGSQNTIIGIETGFNNTASTNVLIGYQNYKTNTTGGNNVSIGTQSGYSSTNASGNVIIGYSTAYGITSGDNNVIIGNSAGSQIGDSDSCVFIGMQSGFYETGSQKLIIANQKYSNEADARDSSLIYGDFATDWLEINGTLRAKRIIHGFFYFEDSTETITINTQNVWEHVTNENNTLFIDVESDDVNISNDTIDIEYTGHYLFNWSAVVDGNNGNNIEIRIYNITDGVGVPGKSGCTTRGSSEDGISSYSYDVNATAGDKYVMQVRNKSGTANVDFIDASIFAEEKHMH